MERQTPNGLAEGSQPERPYEKSGLRRGEGKASPACPVQANDPGLASGLRDGRIQTTFTVNQSRTPNLGPLGWFRVLRACPGPPKPLAGPGRLVAQFGVGGSTSGVSGGVRGVRGRPGACRGVRICPGGLSGGCPGTPRTWSGTFFVALSSVGHRGVGRMECALE